jgi:hypothetical protein
MTSSASKTESETHRWVSNSRVCKVMYRELEGGSDASGQVEELRYPSQVVERLLFALRSSSLVYPKARRKMGIWDVGFLGRL